MFVVIVFVCVLFNLPSALRIKEARVSHFSAGKLVLTCPSTGTYIISSFTHNSKALLSSAYMDKITAEERRQYLL